MLHILLLVLKIAGIVIAVLLGLILLILAAVLFIPIKYDMWGQYDGKPTLKIKVSWLLHFLHAAISYDGELKVKVKVLMFSLYRSGAEKEKKEGSKKTKKADRQKEKTIFDVPEQKQQPEQKVQKPEQPKNEHQPIKDMEASKQFTKWEQPEKEQELPKKTRFQILKDKILGIFRKILAFIRGIINKSISIKETVSEKVTAVSDIIHDSENRELAVFLWNNTKKLIKKIKPRKYRIKVRYGFEDSQMTGWLAVRLAVVYGLLGMDVELIPDFDQSILVGELMLKGRIRLFGILLIAGKVYFNELVQKKLIKKNH